MSELSQVSCVHRRKDEPPLSDAELAVFHPLVPAWKIVQDGGTRKLQNTYSFESEQLCREFIDRVMALADIENHHPVVEQEETRIVVDWWTHSINDLHPNDFIMAAKTDGAYSLIVVGAEGDMTTDERLPTLADIPKFRNTVAHRYPLPEDTED